MGQSFLVRDATAVFLDVQEPTTVPGFENNKAKYRGYFIIDPDHTTVLPNGTKVLTVSLFHDAIVELLRSKAEKSFFSFHKTQPTPQQLREHALAMYENMENPFCGITKARADGKYADQEGKFFFKCTSSKVALFIPEPNPENPLKTRYRKIANEDSENWFYPGGVYSVKIDINLFQLNGTLFSYFNGMYWRQKGNPRNYAAAEEEEAPMLDDGIDAGDAPCLDADPFMAASLDV